ncbi:MAG: hypothetical protein ACYC3X_23390 [Pirellulaceae bacterium]
MSRFQQLALGICLVSAALQTMVFARGFAGVAAQDNLGIPSRGHMGFPTGGIGGFAGGHMSGLHEVGMPGRNEFDTLVPVTLDNLRADGRLHPYGMPPMGARGDFHPGGLPGMGGFGGLHPVNMPDVFDTMGGLRMGGTMTNDGGSARLADDPVPPGGFETGRLQTDLPVAPAGKFADALETFVTQPDEFESQTEPLKALSAANRFPNMPTDAGMRAVGGTRTGRGTTAGKTPAVETFAPETARAADASSALERLSEASHFTGLPTDSGMHTVGGTRTERETTSDEMPAVETRAPNPARDVVAGRDAAVSQDVIAVPRGIAGGNHLAVRSHEALGSYGTVGNWLAAAGGDSGSSTDDHAASLGVNRWFVEHAVYTSAWCDTHAWAWCPAAYEVADWTRMVWSVATWDEAARWLAWDSPSVRADDGFNFYRRSSAVDNGSQPAAKAAAPLDYKQANTLANSNREAQDSQDDQWLVLGVFALVPPGQQDPELVFQLAINQQGVIRGNSYEQVSDSNLPVRGAVRRRSQRAAWTVGNNSQVVIEAELGSLTRDRAPALVHLSADKTVQYLMIREQPQREDLQEPEQEPAESSEAGPNSRDR